MIETSPTDLQAKIRKILTLAERASTEAEAQTAMAMAHAMLAKYNLRLSDVQAQDTPETPIISDDSVPYHKRGQAWEGWIYRAVAELNFCTIYIVARTSGKRYVLVGRAHNVAAAHDTAQALIAVGQRLAVAGAREAGRPAAEQGIVFNFKAWAASFLIGYGARIDERAGATKAEAIRGILPDTETGTALVLAPLYQRESQAVAAYLQTAGVRIGHGRTSRTTIKSTSGYQAGRNAGNTATFDHAPRRLSA